MKKRNYLLKGNNWRLEKIKRKWKLTSKYGLHAERTTLWAFRYFPSAANVQSTNVPDSSNVSKFCISVVWWLFHLRQNCWSSSILLNSRYLVRLSRLNSSNKKSWRKQKRKTKNWSMLPSFELYLKHLTFLFCFWDKQTVNIKTWFFFLFFKRNKRVFCRLRVMSLEPGPASSATKRGSFQNGCDASASVGTASLSLCAYSPNGNMLGEKWGWCGRTRMYSACDSSEAAQHENAMVRLHPSSLTQRRTKRWPRPGIRSIGFFFFNFFYGKRESEETLFLPFQNQYSTKKQRFIRRKLLNIQFLNKNDSIIYKKKKKNKFKKSKIKSYSSNWW